MSGAKSLDRALSAFKRVIVSSGTIHAADIADQLHIPLATVYRYLAAFERKGLVRRERGGALSVGADLLMLVDGARFKFLLAEVARPVIESLAVEVGATAHLGVFEQDMVTYLVKARTDTQGVFTREGRQLEAYCSGIGKMLLAHLSREALNGYLEGGPFPALTANTITEAPLLRRELKKTARRGYAIDNAEIHEGLYCIAAPVLNKDGKAVAALSVSSNLQELASPRSTMVSALKSASQEISDLLYGAR